MIKRLTFVFAVFLLGGMFMVAKADTIVLNGGEIGPHDAAWNLTADRNFDWQSSANFDRGFVEVADGTTIKSSSAFLDVDAHHATGDWMRNTDPGNPGDPFDFHRTDWGAGSKHFDWGHRGHHGHDGWGAGSGSNGSGSTSGSTGSVATPEPGTIFLLGAGLLGIALLKLRK
jgi:hypothetical protein